MNRLFGLAPFAAGVLSALLVAAVAGAGLGAPIAVPPLPTSATATPSYPAVGSGVFDADAARLHLIYLADPARQGRLTGSPGYREAATYLGDRFRDIGLEPAGDGGTYFQHFPLGVPVLAANASLAITAPERHAFALRADFSELVGGPRGAGDVEAGVVYVGGAVDTLAYSDFANVDVSGRIVLIGASTEGGDYAGNAIRRGARALLLVAANEAGPLIHYSYLADIAPNAVPTLLLTEPAADRLVGPAGRKIAELRSQAEAQRNQPDRKPLSFDTGVTVRANVPVAPHDVDAFNVVGVLRPPSGDPARWIVVGGHLDGVGTDPDGTVYPAANDNASGPALTIEVARAVAANRAELRLGVVFVAWAAEEEGLKGSSEFLRRAAGTRLSADRLAAYLNLDVVGCCGERLAASNENQSLYAAIANAAKKEGTTLGVTRGTSDHDAFARAGVPAAIVIWTQLGPIHTPHDTADGVDAAHLDLVGRIVVQTVLDLAGNR